MHPLLRVDGNQCVCYSKFDHPCSSKWHLCVYICKKEFIFRHFLPFCHLLMGLESWLIPLVTAAIASRGTASFDQEMVEKNREYGQKAPSVFCTDVRWQLMLSVVFTHIDVVMLKPVNLSRCSYRCYTNPFPTSNSKFHPGTRTDSWGRRQIAMQLVSSKNTIPVSTKGLLLLHRCETAPTGLSFHLFVAGLREQRPNVRLLGAEYFLGLENIFPKSKLLYKRLLSS